MSEQEPSQTKKIRDSEVIAELRKENNELKEDIHQMKVGWNGYLKANKSTITPEEFIKHINKQENISDWFSDLNRSQASWRIDQDEAYIYYKEIIESWNYKKYEDSIKDYSKTIGVPYFKGFTLTMYHLMRYYVHLYEEKKDSLC